MVHTQHNEVITDMGTWNSAAQGQKAHFYSIARPRAEGELAIGGAIPAATVRFIPRHHLRLESLLLAGQSNTRVPIVERNELTAALVSKSGR